VAVVLVQRIVDQMHLWLLVLFAYAQVERRLPAFGVIEDHAVPARGEQFNRANGRHLATEMKTHVVTPEVHDHRCWYH